MTDRTGWLTDKILAYDHAKEAEQALLEQAAQIQRLTAEREAWLNLNAVVKSLTATPKDG
jgi:hypothetical protein